MENKLHGGLHGVHDGVWQSIISRCDSAGAADLLELAASPGWPMLLPLAEYDVRT